eukprot:CAMPEP_0118979880 /NCGR_PEP_ID=MMETSP1173-20130426/26932_1 /TAXON_ID=1034831 /ORGANISM="Rhizochromulina marina cf, Strain CCMP1243" /LENGTH=419 /DNA_ID=CAMNT_0006930167 /DNA_START=19 /DNA_END=1275 /DNA_ORIENTATION=+
MADMLLAKSSRLQELEAAMEDFVNNHCIPAEGPFEEALGHGAQRWQAVPQIMEDLKAEARRRGLWNLWLPKEFPQGAGLTNAEYAVLAEITGRSLLAPEACNCSAPDTGNMEVLLRYGSAEQKQRWLEPLLNGEIRSAFLMTEPEVASSDATNIRCTFTREPDGGYTIQGRKWWSSGAMDPRCRIAVVMGTVVGKPGQEQSSHSKQTMLLMPMDLPGVKVLRPLQVFGYDDAPHGHAEVLLDSVRVGPEALLLGEGKGFEIAQGRLGPGRVHHCMRLVGAAERSLRVAAARAVDPRKSAFGQPVLGKLGVVRQQLARSRATIEQAKLLVMACAVALDQHSGQGSRPPRVRQLIALIKAAVPIACERAIDQCLQILGSEGVSQDSPVARALIAARTLRLADGPDEVHELVVARYELKAAM